MAHKSAITDLLSRKNQFFIVMINKIEFVRARKLPLNSNFRKSNYSTLKRRVCLDIVFLEVVD